MPLWTARSSGMTGMWQATSGMSACRWQACKAGKACKECVTGDPGRILFYDNSLWLMCYLHALVLTKSMDIG